MFFTAFMEERVKNNNNIEGLHFHLYEDKKDIGKHELTPENRDHLHNDIKIPVKFCNDLRQMQN